MLLIYWSPDVDGAASRFVDRDLRPSSTSGGDFAGDISDHHPGTQVAECAFQFLL
jgi:hypothetical protein